MKDIMCFVGPVVLPIAAALIIIGSYFTNIYKVVQLDFEPPYKTELIRCVGVALPPVSLIVGYMTFDEER